ncbi:in malignant brain tumors 1 neurotrypsin-like [Octopus vulgaris]|uniref:In malignant brain tumors 1 neurotrypsin-like n=1 Tax=Octopus vulgaris TaxID=6645 RepID=A0AA36B6K7_OCTVU|nr:in malignant brain tumors 1 neurotrypsin-like [Octopus vulgaris]
MYFWQFQIIQLLLLPAFILTLQGNRDTNSLVRLIGGSNPGEGRVEVFHKGHWTTICDDDWDVADARVICRMVGDYSKAIPFYNARFGKGEGNITITDVKCHGKESTIFECSYREKNYCLHKDDASVGCFKTQHVTKEKEVSTLPERKETIEIKVRLVGGLNNTHGLVEIFHQENWGTICNHEWSYKNAQVICRMLGYLNGEKYESRLATGIVPLYSVKCEGHEQTISHCPLERPMDNGCPDNNYAVGVTCTNNKQQLSPVPTSTDHAHNACKPMIVCLSALIPPLILTVCNFLFVRLFVF